jgi:hypothetical protein
MSRISVTASFDSDTESVRLLGIGLRTLQRKLKEYKEQGFYSD